jgi:transcriptional regulator with XRE-family HTH domain
MYIAENLKSLRKSRDWTQEDVADAMSVSPQSVSKWERGDTLPDITLLPALSNLFSVSVDELIGMSKINDVNARNTVFSQAHNYLKTHEYGKAADALETALKTFPNDTGIMSDLAIALALVGGTANLRRSIELCERIVSSDEGGKVHHTTRAALCFCYWKFGEKEMSVKTAQNLPHARESREHVMAQFERNGDDTDFVDSYLRYIALGENGWQDIAIVGFD